MSTIISRNPLNSNTCICKTNYSEICGSLWGAYNIEKKIQISLNSLKFIIYENIFETNNFHLVVSVPGEVYDRKSTRSEIYVYIDTLYKKNNTRINPVTVSLS
jgi:hypothetical protein